MSTATSRSSTAPSCARPRSRRPPRAWPAARRRDRWPWPGRPGRSRSRRSRARPAGRCSSWRRATTRRATSPRSWAPCSGAGRWPCGPRAGCRRAAPWGRRPTWWACARAPSRPSDRPGRVVWPARRRWRSACPRPPRARSRSRWPWARRSPWTSLVDRLVAMGYERVPQVEERGDLSVRGGILDVYPSTADLPARIELFGDEVESMRAFSPFTQRTIRPDLAARRVARGRAAAGRTWPTRSPTPGPAARRSCAWRPPSTRPPCARRRAARGRGGRRRAGRRPRGCEAALARARRRSTSRPPGRIGARRPSTRSRRASPTRSAIARPRASCARLGARRAAGGGGLRPPRRHGARGRPAGAPAPGGARARGAAARRARSACRCMPLRAGLRLARPRRRRSSPRSASCAAAAPPAERGPVVGRRLASFLDLKVGDHVVHEDHGIGRLTGFETRTVAGADPRLPGPGVRRRGPALRAARPARPGDPLRGRRRLAARALEAGRQGLGPHEVARAGGRARDGRRADRALRGARARPTGFAFPADDELHPRASSGASPTGRRPTSSAPSTRWPTTWSAPARWTG